MDLKNEIAKVDCKKKTQYINYNNSILTNIKFPLSLIIGLVVGFYLKNRKGIHIILKYLVPILVFILVITVIEKLIQNSLDEKQINNMIQECEKSKAYLTDIIDNKQPEPLHNLQQEAEKHNEHSEQDIQNNFVLENFNLEKDLDKLHDENIFHTSTKHHPLELNDNNMNSNECLLGKNKCSPLCSGFSDNSCNIVADVPGPQWQVQNAATVQNRLMNGNYVPGNCY